MEYTKEQIEFLKSLDFMRLGQALSREQWQSAAMVVRRLEEKEKAAGMNEFEKNFTNLRQCINRKQKEEAKQILCIVISKRAKHLNEIFQ